MGEPQQKSSLARYEEEFIGMLQSMNLDMMEMAEEDFMTDHAYNQLSMLQKKQSDQIKTAFRHIKNLIGSEYFRKRLPNGMETSQRKKRMSEKAKREDAVLFPDRYSICPSCDSVFMTRGSLQRHRVKTLKCSIIKCSKKGALEFGSHNAPEEISAYINDHLDDADSDEEVECQIQDDITAENELSEPNLLTLDENEGPGISIIMSQLAEMGIDE